MIAKFFKQLYSETKSDIVYLHKLWVAYKFRRLKKKALRLRDRYKEVVLIVRIDGRLVFTTPTATKKMWRKGRLKKHYNFAKLSKQALYKTPPYSHD